MRPKIFGCITWLAGLMRRLLLIGAISGSLMHATLAALPVVDAAQLFRWVQQAQQMSQQLTQLEYQVRALTNVPQNLLQEAQQLLQNGLRNPLGDLQGSLQAMLSGRGTGNCSGSDTLLQTNMYAAPGGSDFTGALLGASAQRNAGMSACMQQSLGAIQGRLNVMPGLLQQLQACTSVTCTDAVGARIQQENATINAQNMQIQTLYQTSQIQHQTMEDQIAQKQRMDSLQRMQQTAATQGGEQFREVEGPQPFTAQ